MARSAHEAPNAQADEKARVERAGGALSDVDTYPYSLIGSDLRSFPRLGRAPGIPPSSHLGLPSHMAVGSFLGFASHLAVGSLLGRSPDVAVVSLLGFPRVEASPQLGLGAHPQLVEVGEEGQQVREQEGKLVREQVWEQVRQQVGQVVVVEELRR